MNITHHKNGEIKTLVEEAPYHPGYEDAGFKPKVVNNEPVAWMQIHYKDKMCVTKLSPVKTWGDDVPLYTHPSEHDLGIAEAIGFEKGHESAADMLRQQQAEIEALKERNKELEKFYKNVKARMDI